MVVSRIRTGACHPLGVIEAEKYVQRPRLNARRTAVARPGNVQYRRPDFVQPGGDFESGCLANADAQIGTAKLLGDAASKRGTPTQLLSVKNQRGIAVDHVLTGSNLVV